MTFARTVKQRRPAERAVLRLIRGNPDATRPDSTDMSDGAVAEVYQLSQDQMSSFADLRRGCRNLEISIFPPGSLYVSADELSILGWLATRQRGLLPLNRRLMLLADELALCALALNEVGLKLPSQAVAAGERPMMLR